MASRFTKQQERPHSRQVIPAGIDRDALQAARNTTAVSSRQPLGNQAVQRFAQSCPLRMPSPGACPFGGACHTCPAASKQVLPTPPRIQRQVDQAPRQQIQRAVSFDPGCESDLYLKCAIYEGVRDARRVVDTVLAELEPIVAGTVNSGRIVDLLNVHFHVPSPEQIQEIYDRFQQLSSALQTPPTLNCLALNAPECATTEEDGVTGGRSTVCGGGAIDICGMFKHFSCTTRSHVIIHEMAHHELCAMRDVYAGLHPGQYMTLTSEQALENADSYAQFAEMVDRGSPICRECYLHTGPRPVEEETEEEPAEEEAVQPKQSDGQTPQVDSALTAQVRSLKGGGQPLPQAARDFFEPRFGSDFSDVRLHTGPRASEAAGVLGARAFTLGQDVVFGTGQYAPETPKGSRLLAHELTHVVQQDSKIRRQPARRRRGREVESRREVQWSRSSPGLLWGPEMLSQGLARSRWRQSRIARTRVQVITARGWLLYNFGVGRTRLDGPKRFARHLRQIVASIRQLLQSRAGRQAAFNVYVGFFGHHSRSGSEGVNRGLAVERPKKVRAWVNANFTPRAGERGRVVDVGHRSLFQQPLWRMEIQRRRESLIPTWIRNQRAALDRAINRSVEVIAFLSVRVNRRQWRRKCIERLKRQYPASDKRIKLGTWVLNNWDFFMSGARSGYAWRPPRGDKYGLFFSPPASSQWINPYIPELDPASSVNYFNSLFNQLAGDVRKLGALRTNTNVECNRWSCLLPSFTDRRSLAEKKARCRARYCRYKKLEREANRGSVQLKDIYVINWGSGQTVCRQCEPPVPYYPYSYPCPPAPSPCEIHYPTR